MNPQGNAFYLNGHIWCCRECTRPIVEGHTESCSQRGSDTMRAAVEQAVTLSVVEPSTTDATIGSLIDQATFAQAREKFYKRVAPQVEAPKLSDEDMLKKYDESMTVFGSRVLRGLGVRVF